MARLFVGNFDFEHRLASPHETISRHVLRIGQELTFLWLLAAKDGDAILFDAPIEPDFLKAAADSGLPLVEIVSSRDAVKWLLGGNRTSITNELVPWGWELCSLAFVSQILPEMPHPDFAAVRAANSRRTSFAMELKSETQLPGSCEITSRDGLTSAIQGLSPSDRWVIKAEFGMSARERILGRGPQCPAKDAAWVQKRLERDGAVFFEPWVERVAEYGTQLKIRGDGEVAQVGVAVLHADQHGGYCGSSTFLSDKLQAEVGFGSLYPCLDAARNLHDELGYYGPIGIDVMQYRIHGGRLAWRPLQDINARWTMGRLTLEGMRFVRPEETAELLFLPWLAEGDPAAFYRNWCRQQPPKARCLRLTPFTLEGQPTHRGGVFRILPREQKSS